MLSELFRPRGGWRPAARPAYGALGVALLGFVMVRSGFEAADGPFSASLISARAALLSVDAGPDQTVGEGNPLSLSESRFLNTGSSTSFTATVGWGDGSSSLGQVELPQMRIIAGHFYTNEGAY